MFEAEVKVMLKKTVADPQGLTIMHALESLGFENLSKVRIGKLIRVELAAESRERVQEDVKVMCEKLLANPVIEDFTLEVKEVQ